MSESIEELRTQIAELQTRVAELEKPAQPPHPSFSHAPINYLDRLSVPANVLADMVHAVPDAQVRAIVQDSRRSTQ